MIVLQFEKFFNFRLYKIMKWYLFIPVIFILLSGCVKEEKYGKLNVEIDFKKFPSMYTCHGDNISPEIRIDGIDEKSSSISIFLIDRDAPNGYFVHWIIWNIKANKSIVIPENIPKKKVVEEPIKALQGENDFGRIGYDGPCPPAGEKHRYYFEVYSLDKFINVEGGAKIEKVKDEMRGHIIQYGEAMATYSFP